MFKNKSRIIASAVISLILIFCAFNFNPQNAAILATRSLGRQIIDYVLNFVIFFVGAYLVLSLLGFIRKKFFSRSK